MRDCKTKASATPRVRITVATLVKAADDVVSPCLLRTHGQKNRKTARATPEGNPVCDSPVCRPSPGEALTTCAWPSKTIFHRANLASC